MGCVLHLLGLVCVCGIGWVWEWKQTPLKLGERPGGEAGSILPGDTGAEPFALSAVAADLRIGRGSCWRGLFLGSLGRIVETSFVILVHNLRFGYCGVEWLFGMVCCCAVVAADGVAAVALLLALPFGLTVLHGGFNSCGCRAHFFFFLNPFCLLSTTAMSAEIGATLRASVFGCGCSEGGGPWHSSTRCDIYAFM